MWFYVEENLYLIKYLHSCCELGFILTHTLLTSSGQMSVVNEIILAAGETGAPKGHPLRHGGNN